ncbi:MAG: radical SAM protein [Myxococcales bacterium]|nr:radical SAM protein [Myxococcales bacterium]
MTGHTLTRGFPKASSYPDSVGVDPQCTGDIPSCMFRNPALVWTRLPCAQRCLFGTHAPGSRAWYDRLVTLVREGTAPVYVVGSRPGAGAHAYFRNHGIHLRQDFVRSVFEVPPADLPVESRMPKSARRDARIAERAGLAVQFRKDNESIQLFYQIYTENCRRLSIQGLPPDFVLFEQRRCPNGFWIAVAVDGELVVGAKLLTVQAGVLRIVEGASRRDSAGLQPEALLTREILRFAQNNGVSFVDYGIAESTNNGLRGFKARMGFHEQADVISLLSRGPSASRPESHSPPPPSRPLMPAAREDIPLLEACNFACGFCYREPWIPKLTMDEVKQRIDTVATERKQSGIALSGGEPTLWGDLCDVIRYAHSRGIADVQLHSNGWKAANYPYAIALAEAGLSSAMISLHSHIATKFAEITGTKTEYFDRTLTAIDNLRHAGVYVLLSHVINAVNSADFPDYISYVARRFPQTEVFVFLVYPSVKGQRHPHLYPRLSTIRRAWLEGLRLAEVLGVKLTVDSLAGFPLCMMVGFEHRSRYFLSLEQEAETAGEVDDHHAKAWEMRKAPQCRSCRWDSRCPGFWSDYLDVHGDDELIAVPTPDPS